MSAASSCIQTSDKLACACATSSVMHAESTPTLPVGAQPKVSCAQSKAASHLMEGLGHPAQASAGPSLPTTAQLEAELERTSYQQKYRRVFKNTLFLLLIAAAAAILVVTLWMPVLRVYGSSMTPTIVDGDIVVLAKTSDYQQGDVIAFYYNNKILIKRVIATSSQWVNLDDDGTVLVDEVALDEPYVDALSLGECDIDLPYQVPDSRVFVMGDHRSVSVDSRSKQIGCVSEEQIVGKLVLRVWPLQNITVF